MKNLFYLEQQQTFGLEVRVVGVVRGKIFRFPTYAILFTEIAFPVSASNSAITP